MVGIRKYIYDAFGDGTRRAGCRSLSEPMQITVSERTYRLIRTEIPPKGEAELKGTGETTIYQVEMPEPAQYDAAQPPSAKA